MLFERQNNYALVNSEIFNKKTLVDFAKEEIKYRERQMQMNTVRNLCNFNSVFCNSKLGGCFTVTNLGFNLFNV